MIHRPSRFTLVIAVLALVSAPILGFSQVLASEPFIAEIGMFAGNFAPRGWAYCDGQLLPISQNTALFSLIGTTYGGDGRTTMALPDLKGRLPMHPGHGPGLTNRILGQKLGSENVTLTVAQLPVHSHELRGNTGRGNSVSPANAIPANDPREDQYTTGSGANVYMHAEGIAATGGGQAHPNLQPSLCVGFIIAIQGLYPSRN